MTATIHLPVHVAKNPGRGTGWTASYGEYPHHLWAEGATAAAARANLTAKVAVALTTITGDEPAFARDDDNGGLWVAVPAADGGSRWWRVTGDGARQTGSTDTPAAQAFAGCTGMTIVPSR